MPSPTLTLSPDEVQAMGPLKFYQLTGYDESVFQSAAKSGYIDPAAISFNGNTLEMTYKSDAGNVKVDARKVVNAGQLDPVTRDVKITTTDGTATRQASTYDKILAQKALDFAGVHDAAAQINVNASAQVPGSASPSTATNAPQAIYYGPGADGPGAPAQVPASSSVLAGFAIPFGVILAALVGLSFLPKSKAPAPAAKGAAA